MLPQAYFTGRVDITEPSETKKELGTKKSVTIVTKSANAYNKGFI